MATYEGLEDLAARLQAGEVEKQASVQRATKTADDTVMVAGRRTPDPFTRLCVETFEAINSLLGEEHLLAAEFREAVERLYEGAEPPGELPSAVAQRALTALRPGRLAPADPSPLISASRLDEIDAVPSTNERLRNAGKLLREINLIWAAGGSYAVVLMLREVTRAAAETLGYASFADLAERHPGGTAFRSAMGRLAEVVSDVSPTSSVTNEPEGVRATLNVRAELDALLEEWIRMSI